MIRSTWGRMKWAEDFLITEMRMLCRFDLTIKGRRAVFHAKAGPFSSQAALKAWRVISADRAEAKFEELSNSLD